MSKRTLLWGSAAFVTALAIALAALFIPSVRAELHEAILTPLIAAFFTVRAYILRLPQLLLWVVPVLVVALLVVRSLFVMPRFTRHRRRERLAQAGEGKLAEMIRRIQRTRVSRFARVRICRQLSDTAMRLLARRHGIPLEEARRRMRQGDWEADREIIGFLTPHRHHGRPTAGKGFLVQLAGTLAFLERFHREG